MVSHLENFPHYLLPVFATALGADLIFFSHKVKNFGENNFFRNHFWGQISSFIEVLWTSFGVILVHLEVKKMTPGVILKKEGRPSQWHPTAVKRIMLNV
jgi:hypothetical protein